MSGDFELHEAVKSDDLSLVKSLIEKHRASVNVADSFSKTPLHYASFNGHVAMLELLIANGANVGVADGDGATALHLASSGGHSKLVNLLLKAGADVDAVDRNGNTALYLASSAGHAEVILVLIENHAEVNVPCHFKKTALHAASEVDHELVVKLLLDHSALVNAIDQDLRTSLHLASQNGHWHMASLLLKHGAKVDAMDNTGMISLHLASQKGHLQVVRQLLWHGTEVNASDNTGMTPLHLASQKGYPKVVEVLLRGGAAVNAVSKLGETALHLASSAGETAIVNILITHGADIGLVDDSGRVALQCAVSMGHIEAGKILIKRTLLKSPMANKPDYVERDQRFSTSWDEYLTKVNGIFQELIAQYDVETVASLLSDDFPLVKLSIEAHKADLNKADERGRRLLHYASLHGHVAMLELLIANGANVGVADEDGATALHLASSGGHPKVINLLLAAGTDVDALDLNGNTSLYLASSAGHEKVILVLIENKAEVNRPCYLKRTALHVASEMNHEGVVKLLLNHGAVIDAIDTDERTALHLASQKGYLHIVSRLLKHGAKADSPDRTGMTPLHLASYHDCAKLVELLLKERATVNAVSKLGETALHLASSAGETAIVNILITHGADIGLVDESGRVALWYAVFMGHIEAGKILIKRTLLKNPTTNKPDYVERDQQFSTCWDEYSTKINEVYQKLLKRYDSRTVISILSEIAWEDRDKDKREALVSFYYYFEEVFAEKFFKQADCLAALRGSQPSDRSKRNAVREGCEISWEDVDELNEEKEKTRELSKIKINSDKLLAKLKNPTMSKIKRAQLFHLADKVSMTASAKGEVEKLVKYHNRLRYLQKVAYVSGIAMHVMIAKNLVRDVLQGDLEGVAVNLGLIIGSQVFAILAEALYVKKGLRLASPFLARGTSAFIVYDLVNQIKAYRAGNPDAAVGIIGDSVYLGVDGVELGIEIAEIGGLLEGVSAVTGPIGAAVGAVVFVGTDVYLAVKRVKQEDALIHLTTKEKWIEVGRAVVGMQPESYLEKLLEEKQRNNQLYSQGIDFLKNNTDFQRYIFPTVEAVKEGSIDKLEINLHNAVVLKEKQKDFKWSRTKPDVVEGSLFCAPVGDDITIPREGAYYCENAMGVAYFDGRTGNITLIDLKDGNDLVSGFPYGDHFVILGSGFKLVTLGQGDDTFLLTGTPLDSMLDGGGGTNTLDLREFARGERAIFINVTFTLLEPRNLIESEESRNVSSVVLSKLEKNKYMPYVKGIIGITRLLLRPHGQDLVTICLDDIQYVDGRGGEDSYSWDKITIDSDHCLGNGRVSNHHYSLTLIVRPYTSIINTAETGDFIYIVPRKELGKKRERVLVAPIDNEGTFHRFFINYTLYELNALEKTKSTFILGLDDVGNTALLSKFSNRDESMKGFRVSINPVTDNSQYYLSDGTEIKVGDSGFYALQSTNKSVDTIIKDYPRIAEYLNITIVVQSLLSNESVLIGHGKHDVLSNDPYRRSHLVGNAGENIFVINSGNAVLDKSKLPLPEVVLYDKDEENLIDTLDLREIRSQLEECYGVEIKARVSLILDTSDIAIELFSAENKSINLVTVRLKDAFVTNWHERLHIMLHHAPMVLDELDLEPLSLAFRPDNEVIIISPDVIEQDTQLIIPKQLGHYYFMRWGNSLFLSDVWDGNLAENQRYIVMLKDFYQHPELATLLIKFADKELALTDERTNIENATDFLMEYKRHNQSLNDMLFNNKEIKETEEDLFFTRRPRAHGFHLQAEEEAARVVRNEIDEKTAYDSLWQSSTGYFLMGGMIIFGISGIAAVTAAGMLGYRYLRGWRLIPSNRVPAFTDKRALALGISLLAERTVGAKPLNKKEIDDKGSQAVKGDPSSVVFDKDSVGVVCLLKYVMHYLGWKTAVNRMNQVELLQENKSHGATPVLDAVEKKVKVALENAEGRYGGVYDEKFKKVLFDSEKRISKAPSVYENLKMKRKAAAHFFKVPVQKWVVNDSSMNISSTEQVYAIGQ